MARFEMVEENDDDFTCRIRYISGAGTEKMMDGIYCSRCFLPHQVGAFVKGVCVNCGNRIEVDDPEDDIDAFLDSLDVSKSTRKVYASKIRNGDEKLTKRYDNWKEQKG